MRSFCAFARFFICTLALVCCMLQQLRRMVEVEGSDGGLRCGPEEIWVVEIEVGIGTRTSLIEATNAYKRLGLPEE